LCYDNLVVATPLGQNCNGEEGMKIEIISFLEAVVAGVVAYYICKWLDDSFDSGNE